MRTSGREDSNLSGHLGRGFGRCQPYFAARKQSFSVCHLNKRLDSGGRSGICDTMRDMPVFSPENLDLAEIFRSAEMELKAASIFIEFSSSAYSTGKLQRAADARTKAELACTRAAMLLQHARVQTSR